jgi:vacuolar-type H+-ATPase subunit I/STV1
MKKSVIAALLSLTVAFTARAQWIVYDPTMNMQQIMAQAQNIAKYVEMVNNQVQQIQKLTDQLNEFKHYEDLFGDPKSVLLATVQPLVNDLTKTELGQTLTTLETTVNAGQAMVYNANGLFHSVGTTFTTPNGQTVNRQQATYLPVAAVQKTTDNYLTVSTDAAARRVALKNEIAATTTQLKAAKTDAEVQKLTGVLIGLSAALNNTDYELNQATASALVQDVANRNDEQRQIEAQKEQQHAEFTEAIQQYGQKFRLMNAPTLFPTQ